MAAADGSPWKIHMVLEQIPLTLDEHVLQSAGLEKFSIEVELKPENAATLTQHGDFIQPGLAGT